MKPIKNIFIALAMAVATPVLAQSTTDGVFFKVEGKGLKQPSYLLGTVHLIHGDYTHKIAGLDSLLDRIGCLATELKMEYLLHPETVKQSPDLGLSHEDSVKAETLIPPIMAEFTDMTQADPYSRYLTPEQLDSLDASMKFFNLDAIIKALPQGQGLQGENFHRRIDPFSMAQLAPTLLTVKQMQNSIMSGYSQNYEMMDHTIMLGINSKNEAYKKEHPDAKQDHVLCVGLDSTYAYVQYEESKSVNIKELLNNMTTKSMVDFIYGKLMNIYKTGLALEQVESLYRQGKGNDIIKLVAEAEPDGYYNKELVDGRNQYWMTRIPSLMKKQPTLVAVGLAHLLQTPASKGIIAMLQEQGYKVTPIHP
jgi:uncharacterized protein YbaP (TraB family)